MPVIATSVDTDAEWDEFLASSARGQFQQASGWARLKAHEGWSAVREYLDSSTPRLGGFQLLWKRSKLMRVGYVTKGPVLREETQPAVNAALGRLTAVARRLRLAAVVVQPPDESTITSEVLVRHGFFSQPVDSVIRATGIISLEGGADGVVKRMSRTARQNWRSACRQGVKLTWGAREDLPLFFHLMSGSSLRQHETPNPSRVDLLEALWDALPNRTNLAFAEHGGRKLAGLLMIRDGDRIVFWKRGWDSEEPHLFVSQFIMTECLVWASAIGHTGADVVSMSPEVAAKILANEEVPEGRNGRDVFHIRLGARPKVLPPAHLLVVNPLLRRTLYRGLGWQRLRCALERYVRSG